MEAKMRLTRGLGKNLLIWSALSFIVGVLLFLTPYPLMQGIGLQAMLWGMIDSIIAVFTLYKQSEQEVARIARILRINIGLDVVYQVVGLLLLVLLWQDLFIVGNGFGVIIQGAFLLVLDFYYYSKFIKLGALSQD